MSKSTVTEPVTEPVIEPVAEDKDNLGYLFKDFLEVLFLRTEHKRLKEALNVFYSPCPVCAVARSIKELMYFPPPDCSACDPGVAKRCVVWGRQMKALDVLYDEVCDRLAELTITFYW